MSAKDWVSGRGPGGGVAWAMGGEPRTGAGLSEDQIERLMGLGASEAVATLDLPNQADKMPSVEGQAFPGPIAERMFWDDSDIVGAQGPVGSGKTTTVLKSRLRRAVMMPRSTKDLFTPDSEAEFGWRPLTPDEAAQVSETIIPGLPRRSISAVSPRATRRPEIDVSGIAARHSRVTSSTTFSNEPLWHHWFEPNGE